MNLFLRVSILLCSITHLTCSSEISCNAEFGVDITEGELLETRDILKDSVTYTQENYIKKANVTIGCICNIKTCLRKCCPMGEYLTNKTCQLTDTPFIIPDTKGPSLDNFFIVHGKDCKANTKRTLLNPQINKKFEFVIKKNGILFIPVTREKFDQMNYCVDYIDDVGEMRALVCGSNKTIVSVTNVIAMIISMPFLLATFIVYALLPDRNLHGKCLMCYVISLFGAYLLLVIIQVYPHDLDVSSCKVVGIVGLFFFMVSFFLMNVMSIDIWWTFSGFRGFPSGRKETENKRLLLYSAYAWGVPLLLIVVVTSLTVSPSIPFNAWYNPGIANGQCWFKEDIAKLIYFYGPMAILIMANLIMFIVTAFRIKRMQKDAAVFQKDESKKHNYENDKQRFNLYLKLMLAMGINWSTEIISWAVNWKIVQVPQCVFYFTDFLNAMYGVFIFFIFVFKKNTWKALKKRYYMMLEKPNTTITLVDYTPRTTAVSVGPTVKIGEGACDGSSALTNQVA